ncbi:MAG: branched-chain amino acid ABC transporter permease [Deltaproteobacteria bacterium]|nr:branched-chain amino acid ABC transporter permease [Deltaproteobacteria bacterium]
MRRLPSGYFIQSYKQDMAVIHTRHQWALAAAAAVFLLTLPLCVDEYYLSILINIGIIIIAVLGLNILTGYCGQLSIAHAAFVAVGAYSSALLTSELGFPFGLALPSAALIAGLAGILFGFTSLRFKGFYLVVSTLAAQVVILFIISHWTSLTGGPLGYFTEYASIFGFEFHTNHRFYYLLLLVLTVGTFFAKNLARTKAGRAFVAVRDSEYAAESMGISPWASKLLAFFIGCAYAGVAGSMLAHWTATISPDFFTLNQSIWYLGYIIVGGLGTTVGPFFGVSFFLILGEILSFGVGELSKAYPQALEWVVTGKELLYGLIIMAFLILEPRGLAYRWELIKTWYRLWPFTY